MFESLMGVVDVQAGFVSSFLEGVKNYGLIFAGFSLVVFFHELGHFLAAKACGVKVDRFAVGFGKEIFGFTRGETRYSFNLLPIGGFVKMLGQEDFAIDKSGELMVKEDPRAFTHKPIGQRMFIVSAGVIMNLIFAAVVFMLVFMIGVKFPPAEIGLLEPESPAEYAGLRVGDRIIEINNQEISDFNDVRPAVLLSDPSEPSKVVVSRPDPQGGKPTIMTFHIQPERNEDENKLQIGVAPPMSNRIGYVLPDPTIPADKQLQVGDTILAVNGEKVTDLWGIEEKLVSLKGGWGDLTVERAGEDKRVQQIQARRRARLTFRTTGEMFRDTGHLLGLIPRRQVTVVNAGERADVAGIRPGDVIVSWGQQVAPLMSEILDSVRDNAERPIRVSILRPLPDGGEETVSIEVRPKPEGFFKSGKPKVGMDPYGQEEERLVVADIATIVVENQPTPAEKLKKEMPRGSLITKVNDEPVKTWSELSDRFVTLAGTDVKLTWVYEKQPEQSATIHVPHTLGTTFDLPPEHRITKINGKTSFEDHVNGKPVRYGADSWIGARYLLKECIGQTIEVEHRALTESVSKTEKITVTAEMLDTWVQRVQYFVRDRLITEFVMTEIQVSNPAKAMMIGLRKTYYFIEQVYMMMKRMIFTRSVGLDQVSGPVGIVKMGSEIAGEDFVKLLYFLALISANLAVINFLPLPIVDGGLFVFLLIEKIKGSPISLKVQVATQVIGVVLIIGVFIFVTIQDLTKLSG